MTVAEMIAQRTAALRTVLHDSDQAIHAKGGTPADDLSGLQDAILSIPSGGGALPVLTNPAAAGDVIAGKEYIDASGTKKAGTLVVCDTVGVVETVGSSGVGLEVEIESTAQGGSAILTLPETNLLPENIKSGVNIFGIGGSAKTMRVESGTITLSEDAIKITIPCTDNPKMLVIHLTDAAKETVMQNDMVAAMRAHVVGETYGIGNDANPLNRAMTFLQYHTTGGKRTGINAVCTMAPVTITGSSTVQWIAALEYAWTAYYWEDT